MDKSDQFKLWRFISLSKVQNVALVEKFTTLYKPSPSTRVSWRGLNREIVVGVLSRRSGFLVV